ncbi:MAG: sulfurtransferase [Rhodanobacteraceae bacterium]
MTPLIKARELAAQPPQSVLIVDCRFALADPAQGECDYLEAHVPGAVYAHLDRDLSDLSKPHLGRHPLPDEAVFAATLSRWGWAREKRIVACDDNGGALAAARLWWLARIAGIDAGVLDGGLRAWREAGLPLEQGAGKQRAASRVALHFDPEQIVYAEELKRLREQPAMLLLDARAAQRYRGEVEPIDRKAGHVPGARNRPFSENLGEDGCFKPAQRLREEFAVLLGECDPRDLVHMCGSGVTAAHNLLAMEHAGLSGSRLFAPSWSGWIDEPARPVATGDGSGAPTPSPPKPSP